MTAKAGRKGPTPVRRPDLDTVFTINADGSRNTLHPADVHGRWQVRKNLLFTLLTIVYVGMPWIEVGRHPLVHLDVPGRAAHLFGRTFTNQDFYLAFFLISGLGFALFVATAMWGRVWCGFACPQTVFLEGFYRRVERWIEGPRERRIRRNLGPWTLEKLLRKSTKQVVYLGLSIAIAHVFLSYFIPPRQLLQIVQTAPSEHWATFGWTVFWVLLLYFDFAWFREQTCLVVCPYGRLQSALIDDDTIIIGYDDKRGEPRSKAAEEGGDCIDCYRCVAVCPTGIDIRNGLQMECIGCANCIDACDEIMRRIDRPPGLVRYDSCRGFDVGRRHRLLRPRVLIYGFLALLGIVVATISMGERTPFEVRALRSRGLPYTLEDDRIRNVFTLRLQNKTDQEGSYRIELLPADREFSSLELIIARDHLRLHPLEDWTVPIVATMDRNQYQQPFPIHFTVTDSASGRREVAIVKFRGP